LIDQQDNDEARPSKRCKLEKTANTSATVHKSLANKADFCDALKQAEQIDRKYKLKIQEAIKQYPEIVNEFAELVAVLSPTQVSVKPLFSALKLIRTYQRAAMKKNSQKPSCS